MLPYTTPDLPMKIDIGFEYPDVNDIFQPVRPYIPNTLLEYEMQNFTVDGTMLLLIVVAVTTMRNNVVLFLHSCANF